jgi:phosphoadenosine phosphosulfate reductase
MTTLFDDEFEQQAIERIQKFARLSEKMGFVPVLGFSGGKDSQVCYDLCKRAGIQFRAVFNHCFESAETLRFIREQYLEVEWRREVKQGFFENIRTNHNGYLPTVEAAYCCVDYKHNAKYVDDASIVGVRRAESAKRAMRKLLETKNKTLLKKNRQLIADYFSEQCVASGAPHEIQLKPIIDWSDSEVWGYIKRHNIPINPAYKTQNRVGCIICPKANLTSNSKALLEHPKLIDCAIAARKKSNAASDWMITGDKKDYAANKAEYICRWLNHSFRPFTKKQRILADLVIEKYNSLKS